MINCPNCKKELADGTKFCADCGTPIPEPVVEQPVTTNSFCPNCGGAVAPDMVACPSCRTAVANTADTTANYTTTETTVETPLKKKINIPKKFIGIGVTAVALILVASILLSIFSGGKSNYAIYIKDDEAVYSNLTKDEPFEFAEELNGSSLYVSAFHLCNDGKTLFYPDDVTVDGSSLYYRDITKPKRMQRKLTLIL